MRVQHGGYPFFRSAAPRIDAVVPPGDLPILTRGVLRATERPERYWMYNTEDLHHGHKLTEDYRALLDGAERVFDYAKPNLAVYPRAEFCPIELGAIRAGPKREPTAEVLFFGHPTARRLAITAGLGAAMLNGVHAERLTESIRSARVVLCLGAHDNRCNDAFRVFPAIEAGAAALVVEECGETWFNRLVARYGDVVPYDKLEERCRARLASLS